ncbi:hypothetical protein F8A86_01440 [Betaproteobacteria bacterium SCN1]|jgi:hypothetical protein|nr:hypothetical protein F8A86_01440 [Betaproteobacteria bacterium SCN1]MBN8760192.1 hypothetical protein [Thiobacillus sp.]ODU87819.1 MAG: hypothetical protein ABT21_12730 [Thiobacillus sp. SCN 65-179]OJW39480.1 MAG: hypothetical protein BGO61_09970 [Thiobacillus sp. 65-69]
MKLRIAMCLALSAMVLGPAYAGDVESAMKDRAEAQADAAKDMAKRNYELSRDTCKSLSGNARDVCVKDAEAAYIRAKSEARVDEKVGKERAVATAEQMKAQYKAEKARCDGLSGSAKDACVSEAKVRYHQ